MVFTVLLLWLFLEPHYHHKASNHPIISNKFVIFYLQQPPSDKCFDPWDVESLLLLLESGAPASSLTTLNLLKRLLVLWHLLLQGVVLVNFVMRR